MEKVFSCPYNVFASRKSSRIRKFSEIFTVESVNGNGCKEIVSIHFFLPSITLKVVYSLSTEISNHWTVPHKFSDEAQLGFFRAYYVVVRDQDLKLEIQSLCEFNVRVYEEQSRWSRSSVVNRLESAPIIEIIDLFP